jgi:hypothetical protein
MVAGVSNTYDVYKTNAGIATDTETKGCDAETG